MQDYYIKSFEWMVENQTILKIESINSYLEDEIAVQEVELLEGQLRLVCIDNGDMRYDGERNQLQMLENTEYWCSYDGENELIDPVLFADLLTKEINCRGILNSKNYVGNLEIGVSGFEIVVKSRKVNYDRDFSFLRNQIADFCSGLLSRSSSYYSEHFVKNEEYAGEQVNYSEIAYLKEQLSPDKLPAWIDYFLYHAEHKFHKSLELKAIADVEEIDVDFYLNGLVSGNVFPTDKVAGNAGRLGFAPREIFSYEYRMTYDTNENRFVKFFLLYLKEYLEELAEKTDPANKKLSHEISKLQHIIAEKLQHPLWKHISTMEQIPFNSQVLQKKYPYHLIFQMYTEFQMASNVNLSEVDKQYAVGQKDAPMLYQYWVFIMLFEYLAEKYESGYITSDWLTYDGRNLNFTLREGRTSYAKFQVDEAVEICLYYNKAYNQGHFKAEGRSYSHELIPDISLELFREGVLVAIIHFDAKYKVPVNGTDVPDDMNKMHTYKDAILGTVGAYAVCLAEEKIIYQELDKGAEGNTIFPSVGACPLNLNPETLEVELQGIMDIIEAFTQIA